MDISFQPVDAADIIVRVGVAIGMAWGAFRYLFGPRIERWFKASIEPVVEEIAKLKEENEQQHEHNASILAGLRDEISARWERHERDHREIAEDLGRLKGQHDVTPSS